MVKRVQDARLYCSNEQLIRLKGQASTFSLLPNNQTGSVLSGRHGSMFRGRGLNFEELKHYQVGDDIRNLDWKVTMRTGKPHVRAYSEEKDHNVVICVDQSVSMFFSSVDTMKSVVAAELSALVAWRANKDNDRVSFILFNDNDVQWLKPTRSQKVLLNYLKVLSDLNNQLSVKQSASPTFSTMVQRLTQVKMRNSVIVIISDFAGCSEQDVTNLKYLQRNNDVLSVLVSDQMEQNLSGQNSPNMVLSDGQLQLSVDAADEALAAKMSEHHALKVDQLQKLMTVKRLPLAQVTTDGTHIKQFKRALGGVR